MARIFISYSRADEPFARQLATSLSQLGADVWIDIEDIPVGMKWSRAIQEGLDGADVLLVVISPDSMASQNVEDEWQYYLDQKKPVIPLLYNPTKMHFQLSRIQYIDFNRLSYDKAIRQLHAELGRKGVRLDALPKRTTMTQPIVRMQPAAPVTRESGRTFPITWVMVGGVLLALGVGLGVFLSNPNRFAAQPTGDAPSQSVSTATPPEAIPPTPLPTLAVPTPPDKVDAEGAPGEDFLLYANDAEGIHFHYPLGWWAESYSDSGETIWLVSNSQAVIDLWKREGFGLSNAVGPGEAAIAILPDVGTAMGLGDGYTPWDMASLLQGSLMEANTLFWGDLMSYTLPNGLNAAHVAGSGDSYTVEIKVVESASAGLVLIFGVAALDQATALSSAMGLIAESLEI